MISDRDQPATRNPRRKRRVSKPDSPLNICADAPRASGFLVYDPKKCTGCHTCMFACSLAHEGKSQLTTARIQILEDRLGSFPNDILIATCRQCKDPACLYACPSEALYFDRHYLNLVVVDPEKCNGCRKCEKACHFRPSRIKLHPDRRVAIKCELCRQTPFWEHAPNQLACVEACPVNALLFTSKPPVGYNGYEVNLRREGWGKLDLPTD